MVGFENSDDACVYRINDEIALVQTVDFFPPMVDDPYLFGQIAAANALSDVYAMGGKPTHCMNLVCFPDCLDTKILGRIMEGGYSKVAEAGAVIAGGHSISDPEPKYGLCVSGLIDPRKILKNRGAKADDKLILTKPLGSGILNTAAKGDLVDEEGMKPAVEVMTMLNKRAAEIAENYDVHACTDVTGFGVIGHAMEMLGDGDVNLVINSCDLPIIEGAYEMAEMGLIPAGAYTNRDYFGDKMFFAPEVKQPLIDILCDPQTSGGLLLSVAPEQAEELLAELNKEKHKAAIIGEIVCGEGIVNVR